MQSATSHMRVPVQGTLRNAEQPQHTSFGDLLVSAVLEDSTTRLFPRSTRFSSKVIYRLFQVVGQSKVTSRLDAPLCRVGWVRSAGAPARGGAEAWIDNAMSTGAHTVLPLWHSYRHRGKRLATTQGLHVFVNTSTAHQLLTQMHNSRAELRILGTIKEGIAREAVCCCRHKLMCKQL